MDRLKAINEIGRLEREIEIEEGDDPEADLARLREADSKLRAERRGLRAQLDACDQEPCKTVSTSDDPFAAVTGLPIKPTFNTGGAPGSTDINRGKILTNCPLCTSIATDLNARLAELSRTKERVAKERAKIIQRVEQLRNGAPYTEEEKSIISQYTNAKETESADDDFAAAAGVIAGDMRHDPVLLSYLVLVTSLDDSVRKLEEDVNRLFKALIECEKQCITVEVVDVISIAGNQPFDRRDPISENNETTTTTSTTTTPTTSTTTTTAASTVSVIFCAGCGGGVHIKVTQPRIKISAPDACPTNHYHQSGGAPAIGCDGNTYADPIPGACGYGQVPNTTSVPATSCPTP